MTDSQKKIVASLALVLAAILSLTLGWVGYAGETKELYQEIKDLSSSDLGKMLDSAEDEIEDMLDDVTYLLRYADLNSSDTKKAEALVEDADDILHDAMDLFDRAMDGSLSVFDVMAANGVVRDGLSMGDDVADLVGFKNLDDMMDEYGSRTERELVSDLKTASMGVLIVTWLILLGTLGATIYVVLIYLGVINGKPLALAFVSSLSLVVALITALMANAAAEETVLLPSIFLVLCCAITWAVPLLLPPTQTADAGTLAMPGDAKETLSMLGKKLSDVGQGVASQTKNFTESTRLGGQATSLEREKKEFLAMLGQAYLDRNPSEATQYHPELVGQIQAAVNTLQEIDAQIKALKGSEPCANCGGDVPADAVFCNKCGTPKAAAPVATGPVVPTPVSAPVAPAPVAPIVPPVVPPVAPVAPAPVAPPAEAPAPTPEGACPNCQQPSNGTSAFCVHCGTKLK